MTGYVGLYMTVQWAMYDCVELRRAKYWTINNVVKPLHDGYTTYLTAAVRKLPRKGRPDLGCGGNPTYRSNNSPLYSLIYGNLVPRVFSFSNIENEKREDPGDKVAINQAL